MSLVSRIESLILRLAAEFKAIRRDLGNPTELTTRDQSNLVAAINEVRALIDVTPGLNIIDDENPNAVSTTFLPTGHKKEPHPCGSIHLLPKDFSPQLRPTQYP